jgi:hypothetical protein
MIGYLRVFENSMGGEGQRSNKLNKNGLIGVSRFFLFLYLYPLSILSFLQIKYKCKYTVS